MKFIKTIFLSFFFGSLLTGCFEDLDDVILDASTLEINNFIWRGMNDIYLYKEDVPQLADDYFADQEELNDYLDDFSKPEDLFADLVAPQDRFSFLVDDYVELENALEGIAVTTGMEYGLVRISGSTSAVIGYVRYVLPNTPAAAAGIERGDLFNSINGTPLTLQNYASLLQLPSYDLGLAAFGESGIVSTGEVATLEKEQYTENPVFLAKVFELANGKTGYLMYNSFTGSFDDRLNEVFRMFEAEGIEHLILDLRYNGGGSVESAVDLGSMITGQFQGEIFSTKQWNESYQAYYEEHDPEGLLNRFNDKIRTGEQINNLGLTQVYVITTLRSASASELLINGLEPYIDVIQVGERTTGKFQASVTLYDSPDFKRRGANPGHTYAIQPLVYKSANAAGVTDYLNGLNPDVPIREDLSNLGIIGDPDEPLLNAALNHIEGRMPARKAASRFYELVGESGMNEILYKKMFIDNPPPLFKSTGLNH